MSIVQQLEIRIR